MGKDPNVQVGRIVGVWEAVEITRPSTLNTERRVKCKCLNCGATKEVLWKTFVSTPRHNCLPPIPHDLTGMKFGHLTVLGRDESRPKGHGQKTYWICQCDCPDKTITSVMRTSLVNERTTSCNSVYHRTQHKGERISIIGKTYLDLKVDKALDERAPNGDIMYSCTCRVCGKTNVKVSRSNLTSLRKKDCGCTTRSIGEIRVEEILKDLNYKYETQVHFPELHQLRFDFKVYLNDTDFVLLEYDGEQHFNKESRYYSDEAVARDQIKNNFCLGKGIKLYRIPYTDKTKINKTNLFDEKYLVK